MPVYGVPFISVFEHTYIRPLRVPVAPSGAHHEPGRRLATTGDPPGATMVDPVEGAIEDAVVVAVDRPVFEGVVEDVVDGVVDGAPATTSDQPRIVVPAH